MDGKSGADEAKKGVNIRDVRNFLCNFADAFRKECKDILLYSFTITTANERATTIIEAAPYGRRLPVYSCVLW